MEFNWIAIIGAAFVPMAVGFLWYGPVFGKAWLKSTGKPKEYFEQGNMPVIFGVSFLMALVYSWTLKIFIALTHGDQFVANGIEGIEGSFHTFQHGMLHGATFSFFFALPFFMINGLFERHSQVNIWLSIGYWVVTGALMGGILDAWGG